MEREVGGRIGMGNTCKPMAVSFQCMTKFTTIKNKKRKEKRNYDCPSGLDMWEVIHDFDKICIPGMVGTKVRQKCFQSKLGKRKQI